MEKIDKEILLAMLTGGFLGWLVTSKRRASRKQLPAPTPSPTNSTIAQPQALPQAQPKVQFHEDGSPKITFGEALSALSRFEIKEPYLNEFASAVASKNELDAFIHTEQDALWKQLVQKAVPATIVYCCQNYGIDGAEQTKALTLVAMQCRLKELHVHPAFAYLQDRADAAGQSLVKLLSIMFAQSYIAQFEQYALIIDDTKLVLLVAIQVGESDTTVFYQRTAIGAVDMTAVKNEAPFWFALAADNLQAAYQDYADDCDAHQYKPEWTDAVAKEQKCWFGGTAYDWEQLIKKLDLPAEYNQKR